jgi:type II secretory pathway pseudopilin PulG
MDKNMGGVTLVEIMIALCIIAIFVVGMIAVYTQISKGILVAKYRTIANNIAQEKIESLKNLSYYRLRVTPQAALDNPNDPSNPYPPENISISDLNFTRYTIVKKVKEQDGKIIDLSPSSMDVGLKKIYVYVVWNEGSISFTLSHTNLHENPDRVSLDAMIYGSVTSTSGAGVADVHVFIVDYPGWETYTNINGEYTLYCGSGVRQITAEKRKYCTQTSPSISLASGDNYNYNFTNFALIPTGTLSGYVFKRDNLVISEVCARISFDDPNEYIEIYNPTPTSITLTGDNFKLKYFVENGPIVTLNFDWTTPVIIPSNGYCLFGSTSTLTGVSPPVAVDKVWTNGLIIAEVGGVGIADGNDVWIDKVGWGINLAGRAAPPGSYEGVSLDLAGNGLGVGDCIERRPYPSVSPVGSTLGSAFDSQNNTSDFVEHTSLNPQNTTSSETPIGGTVVMSASVFCDDGLSNPTVSLTTGRYTLVDVKVGTWTVSAVEVKSGQVSGVTVTQNSNTSCDIILTQTSEYGFITGYVFRSDGVTLPNILMESGEQQVTTDSKGWYKFILLPSTYYVIANYNNNNPSLTCETSSAITLLQGQTVSNINFTLSFGGKVSGKITTNGVDALPNITVIAKDVYGAERGSAISDSSGNYTISNLPTTGNPYTILLALDTKETSVPGQTSVNVSTGGIVSGVNFQVTTGLARITGTVKTADGKKITTGVLIIASTSTISDLPPTVDSTLRAGGSIYYSTSSDSNGNYVLYVRGSSSGITYNVYGYYTSEGITKKRTSSISIKTGEVKSVNFTDF